jgi:hypothetical protein
LPGEVAVVGRPPAQQIVVDPELHARDAVLQNAGV